MTVYNADMAATTTQPVTAEELWEMGDIGRCELVEGEIRMMAPAGAEHGDLALGIASRIRLYVEQHQLGRAYGAETGFIIARNPDTVRAPDVAFVKAARLPSHPIRGYFPGAPDLAVEVLSPNDAMSEVLEKVEQWLAAGATSVWVVDPPNQSIQIYRQNKQVLRYGGDDVIRDEIRRGPAEWGEIWDPHTAAAVHVRRSLEGGDWIVVATAHPAKFDEVVEPLIDREVPVPPNLERILTRPSRFTALEPTLDALREVLRAG
jgi:Uma2 family endonuclease